MGHWLRVGRVRVCRVRSRCEVLTETVFVGYSLTQGSHRAGGCVNVSDSRGYLVGARWSEYGRVRAALSFAAEFMVRIEAQGGSSAY